MTKTKQYVIIQRKQKNSQIHFYSPGGVLVLTIESIHSKQQTAPNHVVTRAAPQRPPRRPPRVGGVSCVPKTLPRTKGCHETRICAKSFVSL